MTISRKLVFWIGALAFSVAALLLFRSILLPFVAGIVLAYFLDPLADRLEARGAPRALATTAALLGFLAGLFAAILLFVPLIQEQVAGFAKRLPGLFQDASAGLENVAALAPESLDPERLLAIAGAVAEMQKAVAQWGLAAARGLFASGVAALNLAGLLVITPVVAWYLLRDWDRLVARIDGLLPRDHAEVLRGLAREADMRLAGFIRGQALVCLILGAAYALALELAGLDYGFVIGLISGLVSFIPFVGSLTGLALSAGFGYLQFGLSSDLALLAFIFLAGQAVEGYYLTPKLVGDRVGLHPVWVMFSLLAGGALFGFPGMLLAAPVAAVAGVMVRFSIDRYLGSRVFLGRDSP